MISLEGLFEFEHMNYELDRNPDEEPSLTEMTETAIKILQRANNGFFLLVEGKGPYTYNIMLFDQFSMESLMHPLASWMSSQFQVASYF